MSFFGQASTKKFGGSSSINTKKRNKPDEQSLDVSTSKFNRFNPSYEANVQTEFASNTAIDSNNTYIQQDVIYQQQIVDIMSHEHSNIHTESLQEQENNVDNQQMNGLSVQTDNHSHITSNDINESEIGMESAIRHHTVSPLINSESNMLIHSSLTPLEAHDWRDYDVENIEEMIKNTGNELVQNKKILEEVTRKLEKYTYDINNKVYSILYNYDSITLLPNIISTNKQLNDLDQKLKKLTDYD